MRFLPLATSRAASLVAAPLTVRHPDPVALLLPSCTAQGALGVAAVSGAVGVAAQLALTAVFRRSRSAWLSKEPGYIANQVVAIAYMLAATCIGGAMFCNPSSWPADATTAMLVPDGTIRFLGAVLFGELLIWDLPSAIFVPRLRRPDMLLHHAALAAGPAFIAMAHLPVFYYSWFIGLSELSTLPFCLNELGAYACDALAENEPDSAKLPALTKFRDVAQIFAALSFVAVRVVGWAAVCYLLLRDTLRVLPVVATAGMRQLLKAQLGFALGFYSLQLYWFSKLVRYTLTSGVGGSRTD